MIYDRIQNIKQYKGISYNLNEAIEFLRTTNLKELKEGKHEIYGEHVFARVMLYDTKNVEDGKFESHKEYIDIHVVLEGKEKVLMSDISELEVTQEYVADKDCALHKGEASVSCTVQDDYFVLCFPNDVHMPAIRVNESEHIKKLIVKVRV